MTFLKDRRMIKAVAGAAAAVMLSAFLGGCADWKLLAATMNQSTQSPSTVTADPSSQADKAAQKLISGLGLSGKMNLLKERNMRSLVFQGNEIYSDGVIYLSSSGSCSDTVGVFYVTDLASARQCVEDYVASLKTQTNVFDSSEIFKISNAVIADNGSDEIVLIICSDIEKAKSLAAETVGS